MPASKGPAHFWVARQQSKRLVRGYQETVSDLWIASSSEVIGLFVKVLVGLRANQIMSFHRWLERRRRSASR
jgi:hypothetical protein